MMHGDIFIDERQGSRQETVTALKQTSKVLKQSITTTLGLLFAELCNLFGMVVFGQTSLQIFCLPERLRCTLLGAQNWRQADK